MSVWEEPVTVVRAGVIVKRLTAGFDPRESLLYCDLGTGVQPGDLCTFRGLTRRVVQPVEVWRDGGDVIHLEAAPDWLPDLGHLLRGGGDPIFNEATNTLDPAAATTIWSGPCLVQPEAAGAAVDVAEQQINVQPFTVKAPLTLTDVRAGDAFAVTSSRDQRLITRTLVVTRVQAGSTEQLRVFSAIDSQAVTGD